MCQQCSKIYNGHHSNPEGKQPLKSCCSRSPTTSSPLTKTNTWPPWSDRHQAEKLPSSKISAPHYSLHQGHLQVFIHANCGQTLEHPSCRRHHSFISGRVQGTHLYQLAPGESFLLALVYSSTTVFLLHMHPKFFLSVNIQKWTSLSTDVDVDVDTCIIFCCWVLVISSLEVMKFVYIQY